MKQMIRASLLALVATLFCGGVEAQTPAHREVQGTPFSFEQTLEEQCDALSEALLLSGHARDQFRETYLRYQQEMGEIHREQFRPRPHHESGASRRKSMSDEEVEAMLRKRFAVSRAILDVREKYFEAFLQFLTPRQIQQLYALEKRGAERMHAEHARRRPHTPMGRRE